jgi:ferredoxin
MLSDEVSERIIQIDKEICTGCGTCIEACSYGAIHLGDHRAEVDNALCTKCEACLDTCTFGAITETNKSMPVSSITIRPLTDSGTSIRQQPVLLQETTAAKRELKPLAGAALAFIGSEVAPRLLDILMKSIERSIAHPTTTASSTPAFRPRNHSEKRGFRKQVRHRGGKMANRI